MEQQRTLTGSRDGEDVRAALEGDIEAYGRLVERYQEVAFRAAWLIVRDEAEARDVCQEGFLRAYRYIHRFRPGDPFRPWVLRIVTNLAKNQVRARNRRDGLAARIWRAGSRAVPPPERDVLAAERRSGVLEALTHLPPEDRDVIHLRYFLDLSEAEMAAVLDVRPGTVKSRLSRARGRLRAVIEAHYPELAAVPITEGEHDGDA